ncbi:hypothetical protein WJX84_003889 [Apatococcus fuscideae]|uniref:ER transporter 6TM N-terminal domain-containing protein n=1 Tax=Apatococcus fuscideae TaxID=2026836 RepID=A0AAW1T7P5_9CHLO
MDEARETDDKMDRSPAPCSPKLSPSSVPSIPLCSVSNRKQRTAPFRRASSKICVYLLSDEFKSSLQLAAGVFIAALFVFVRQLRFDLSDLLGVGVVVGLVRVSSGITMGGRIRGAAILGSVTWSIVISSALITIARQTHAYPTWLSILSAVWLGYASVLRVLSGTMGYLLTLISCILILLGQFAWPAGVLWGEVTWAVTRAIWLSCAITMVVGFLVLPTSARDAIPAGLAAHLLFAGHALSRAASHLLEPSPPLNARAATAQSAKEAAMELPRPSLQEYRAKRVDLSADHSLRHAQGAGAKETRKLFAAILKTRQLLKLAPSEPMWMTCCHIELPEWKRIFQEVEIFVAFGASLESHLEGHEPLISEEMMEAAYGPSPLPVFRRVLAVVAASAAAMSQSIAATASPGVHGAPSIASKARDELEAEMGSVMRRCHAAWQKRKHQPEALEAHSHLLEQPLENRLLVMLRVQSRELLSTACRLEGHSRTAMWDRLKLEAEPAVAFLETFCGKDLLDASMGMMQAFIKCFGTWRKTKETLRHNPYFLFGLLFYLASAASLVSMLQAAQHSAIIRKWHSFYLAIAVVSTMQERVDYAIVRGFFRLTMTSIASSIGYVVMLRPRVATNTYALTIISCVWSFLAGHFFIGPYKYGSFMATTAFAAMVFNQYSPLPGSHGTVQFFVARLCEFAIGIGIALIIQFSFPWFLAADVLQQIGVAVSASADVVCRQAEAYLEDLQQVANLAASKAAASGDTGSGHNEESLGAQHPDKDTNESGSMPDDPKAIKGLAMKDITSKVADPLGKVQLQMSREGVVWKHGPLTLPKTAKASISGLQVLVERTVLVHAAVTQDAVLEGQFTPHIYLSIFQPLERGFRDYLSKVRCLGEAVRGALAEQASPKDLEAVTAAVQDVEQCRGSLHQQLRQIRLHNRARRASQAVPGASPSIDDVANADDVYRAAGVLSALGRYTDKLVLLAKATLADTWLCQRAPRRWPTRNAMYL